MKTLIIALLLLSSQSYAAAYTSYNNRTGESFTTYTPNPSPAEILAAGSKAAMASANRPAPASPPFQVRELAPPIGNLGHRAYSAPYDYNDPEDGL